MSKTRKSSMQKRPAAHAEPRIAIAQSNTPVQASGGVTTFMESATQEILAVTYWFDPTPQGEPYAVTVRFSGRRVDVKGRVEARDRFVQDETIEQVVPGSGPISLTARIRNINAGEWVVTAQMQGGTARLFHGQQEQENAVPARSPGPLPRFWRAWAPPAEPDEHVKTCLTPLAHVPGIFPGIWGVMVALGMAVALVLQSLVISLDHLALGRSLELTLVAIAVGVIGAKMWYVVMYRSTHQINGWCIQGFITGATLTAAILLVALKVPAGTFLDATAPGLLIAMAIGRVGCFFAGCCGGPPTASRWGVWSSDQQVGARRIPTQFLELALAGILGMVVLVAVLRHGPTGGALFVGSLAAYVLGRQGILHLRAAPRKTRLGGLITAVLAALVLVTAIVFLVR